MFYLRLYFQIMKVNCSIQMQYRATFIVRLLLYIVMPITDMVVLLTYFSSFETLAGWSAWEVALIYSITSAGFGLTESFARGFDIFPYLIKRGVYDRFLLRPLNTVFQVMTKDFPFYRLNRVVCGAVFIIIAINQLNLDMTVGKVMLICMAVIGSMAIFTGLYIIMGGISFITINPLNIFHLFTDGTREVARYPISAYPKWFARFYCALIPIGCTTYFPVLVILEKPDVLFNTTRSIQLGAITVGYVFLAISLLFWNYCKKKYLSTGT